MSTLRRKPLVASSATPRHTQIRLPATPAWTVLLIPDRFQLIIDSSGTAWTVPDPILIPHIVGLNGVGRATVRTPEGTHVVGNPAMTVANWRDRHGAVEVPMDFPVHAHGEDFATWLVAYDVPRGTHHCWAWEMPIPGPGSTRVERDRDAQIRFLAQIGASFLGPCPDHVLGRIRADLERELMRSRTRRDKSPTHAQIYDLTLAKLTAMGWIEGAEARIGEIEGRADIAAAAPRDAADYLEGMTVAQLEALLERKRAGGPVEPEEEPPAPPTPKPTRKTSSKRVAPVVVDSEGSDGVDSSAGPSDLGGTVQL
jgi:hypothetical protein